MSNNEAYEILKKYDKKNAYTSEFEENVCNSLKISMFRTNKRTDKVIKHLRRKYEQ